MTSWGISPQQSDDAPTPVPMETKLGQEEQEASQGHQYQGHWSQSFLPSFSAQLSFTTPAGLSSPELLALHVSTLGREALALGGAQLLVPPSHPPTPPMSGSSNRSCMHLNE
jgi:hypothetical protein